MQMSLYWMMSQVIKRIAYFKHVFLVYNVAKWRTMLSMLSQLGLSDVRLITFFVHNIPSYQNQLTAADYTTNALMQSLMSVQTAGKY